MINRRQVLAGAAALVAAPARAERTPNILFVTADDLPSVYHNRERFGVSIKTPNLNRLTAAGVSFSNAFASVAVCNPSRSGIMSGMGPFKTGVVTNNVKWWEFLDPNLTFPAILKQRLGYRVTVHGKITHGDHEIWTRAGIADLALKSRTDDQYAVQTAITAMQQPGPWLCMLGLSNPHAPFESPPRFYEPYPLNEIRPLNWSGDVTPGVANNQRTRWEELEALGQEDEYIRDFLANITEFDYWLGEAIDNVPDTTYIILASDHGFHLGHQDAVTKFTLWDEACRAPLVFRGPGILEGVRHKDPVSLLDIAPTILGLVGIESPTRFDGHSLLPMLHDPQALAPTDGALTWSIDGISLRTARYRITRYNNGSVELYDQIADPDARTNLEDENPALRDALLAQLDERAEQWRRTKWR